MEERKGVFWYLNQNPVLKLACGIVSNNTFYFSPCKQNYGGRLLKLEPTKLSWHQIYSKIH